MNLKTFTILLALLLAVGVKAQTPGNAHPKREFRAAWIQTVNGQFKGMSTEKIKQTLVGQLNSLQGAGINAIIFQVRPEADALYASQLEPWSRFLTGIQGQAPSPYWDPMQFMIDECHKRGWNFMHGLILIGRKLIRITIWLPIMFITFIRSGLLLMAISCILIRLCPKAVNTFVW